jgi:heat shock protein HtpX
MTALMERSKKEEWGNRPLPKPGTLTKIWAQATASHPTTERRIGRLAAIARESGYAGPEIERAVSGPVDISHAESIPPETIRMIMQSTFTLV